LVPSQERVLPLRLRQVVPQQFQFRRLASQPPARSVPARQEFQVNQIQAYVK
jgi:hypothetical protein